MNPLNPGASVLTKLGSLIVHYQERDSASGHPFDQNAIDQLENDPEVKDWLKRMDDMAMLPKKRT